MPAGHGTSRRLVAALVLGLVAGLWTFEPARASFTPDQLVQVGQSYLDRGQDAQALEPLRMALAADADHATAHRLMGLALSRLDRPTEAEPHLARAAELDPKSYEVRLLLGMARDLAGDYEAAVAAYEAAIEIDGDRPDAWRELGMTRLLRGDAERAVAALRRAEAAADPPDASLLADLGYALSASGDPDAAVTVLARAAELAPRDADVRFVLGRAHAAAGRVDEAVAAFDAALARRPDHGLAGFHKGLTLAGAGRHADAIAAFEQALPHRPEDARLRVALGRTLAAKGDLAGARTHLEAAVAADAALAPAWRDLARVHEADGRPAEALVALRRAKTLLPENEDLVADIRRVEAAIGAAGRPGGGE